MSDRPKMYFIVDLEMDGYGGDERGGLRGIFRMSCLG